MLYDDVEERHVIEHGIDAECAEYRGALSLFKERLVPDVEEAARCTRLACEMPEVGDAEMNDDPKRVALFRDGARLKELVRIYEKKIARHFGKGLVPPHTFEAAKATLRTIEAGQRGGGVAVLLELLRPQLPLYALSLLLMAFDSAVGPATWHGVAALFDGIADGSTPLDSFGDTVMQTFATLTLCIFAHLTSWAITHRVTARFSNAVLRGVLRQDTVFFDVYPTGVIQERLNHDAEDLASKVFHLPVQVLNCFFIVASNVVAIARMDRQLLFVCMAPLPVVVLVQRLFIGKMERLHQRGRKVAEHAVANTNEVIKELRTVRSFAMEEEEAETFDARTQYKSAIEERTSAVHHCLFIAPLVVMFTGTRLLATYMSGGFVASRLITVGMAVQAGMAAEHLQHCLRDLTHQLPQFVKALAPLSRICDAINSEPRIEPVPSAPPKLAPRTIAGRIDFVDVDFTFPSEPQKQVLHGLSFAALPGQKVAFVGTTGCGKSTAIQLIQRFYAPNAGQILLDGTPLENYDVHHLRRQISVVAQDNVLFSTTIRENIIYGLPRAQREVISDAQIEAACKKANCWEFIRNFPRRLETYCGERGVKLSGGQKQRLAIARAIVRSPTICLLDEATSALDSKSEGLVQAALDNWLGGDSGSANEADTDGDKGKAEGDANADGARQQSGCCIVVAHRLSTIRGCDQILVMDQGRIVERGTHTELLRIPIEKDAGGKMLSGWYSDLWNTQMGEKDPDGDVTALTKAASKAAAEAEAATKADVACLEAENAQLKQQLERLAYAREEADMSSAATTPKGVTPPTSPSVARSKEPSPALARRAQARQPEGAVAAQ